jgi:hypothetical protein
MFSFNSGISDRTSHPFLPLVKGVLFYIFCVIYLTFRLYIFVLLDGVNENNKCKNSKWKNSKYKNSKCFRCLDGICFIFK